VYVFSPAVVKEIRVRDKASELGKPEIHESAHPDANGCGPIQTVTFTVKMRGVDVSSDLAGKN
jgi:hypothetical protein